MLHVSKLFTYETRKEPNKINKRGKINEKRPKKIYEGNEQLRRGRKKNSKENERMGKRKDR
jgi:hypothetical protein